MENECQHKWKVMKTIKTISKNLLGTKTPETIYHMQCEKCGDVCSRRCLGSDNN